MKKIFTTLLVAVAIYSTATAQAQEQVTQSDLAKRVSKLEKRTSILDKINLSGYIQAAYNWDDAGTSTFNLRRARISLAGDVYKGEKGAIIDYKLQAEFTSTPKIIDLWVRYRPYKQLGLQVGQFKMPLMLELTEYSQPKLEFVEFSLAVQRLQRMGSGDVTGISSVGRDMGAQLYGDLLSGDGFGIISYNIAVMNGAGINSKDNNSSKDVIGRLLVRPIKNLTFAGFYMHGEDNFASSALLENFGEVSNPKYTELQRYGGGVRYTSKSIFARAEYIKGETGKLTSEGAYIVAGYYFNSKTSLAARWDYFDEDVSTSTNEQNYTIGINYQPWSALRLQLNYIYKQFNHAESSSGNAISFMVTTQF